MTEISRCVLCVKTSLSSCAVTKTALRVLWLNRAVCTLPCVYIFVCCAMPWHVRGEGRGGGGGFWIAQSCGTSNHTAQVRGFEPEPSEQFLRLIWSACLQKSRLYARSHLCHFLSCLNMQSFLAKPDRPLWSMSCVVQWSSQTCKKKPNKLPSAWNENNIDVPNWRLVSAACFLTVHEKYGSDLKWRKHFAVTLLL